MVHLHTHLDCGLCATVHHEYNMMHGLWKEVGQIAWYHVICKLAKHTL
jgi:hypothetical protein